LSETLYWCKTVDWRTPAAVSQPVRFEISIRWSWLAKKTRERCRGYRQRYDSGTTQGLIYLSRVLPVTENQFVQTKLPVPNKRLISERFIFISPE